MRIPRPSAVALAIASAGAVVVLSSCTCKIKEEQLATIQRLRTEERQLTSDIEQAERNKSRISGELASRQGEVRQCNERKAFVQDKVNKWPNIWPADLQEPAPEPAPVETTPKKKR
ncbi:MAG TPA: hypothetical protein DIS79_01345 [Bacteroidetes bacterium]|nr:hypothetical protein [Bacteroidota bacterium]HRK06081.1 hypothetical protein [Chlorobiota bacterium]